MQGFFPLCERSWLSGSLQASPPPSPGDSACTTLEATLPPPQVSQLLRCRTRGPIKCFFLITPAGGRETCCGFHPSSYRLQTKCAALTLHCFCLGSEATSLFFRCNPSHPSAQVARDVFPFVHPLAFPDTTLQDHDHDDDDNNNNVGRNASVCFLLCRPQRKKTSFVSVCFAFSSE